MARTSKKNAPPVELRRLIYSDRLSEETLCFTADVYVSGVKVGFAKNDGRGGNTHVHVTPASVPAMTAFADTITTTGYGYVRMVGSRPGTTTCCNAFTTFGDDDGQHCKACGESVLHGYMDGVEAYVVDHLVDLAYQAKAKAKNERKLAKVDAQECAKNDARGRLTIRYTVKTPKGILSTWPSLAPGEDPNQIVAKLDEEYKAKGDWRVVS